jgi:hypothetical protein
MTVARSTCAGLIVGLAVLGLWYGLEQGKVSQRTVTEASGANVPPAFGGALAARAEKLAASAPRSHPKLGQSRAGSPTAFDFGKAFRASAEYGSFVVAVLPAAEAGDRDAQYYLYAALAYCDETYNFYFRRPGKVLSVDEAIEERNDHAGPSMTEAIKRAYARCHAITATKNPSLGNSGRMACQSNRCRSAVGADGNCPKNFPAATDPRRDRFRSADSRHRPGHL